MYTSPQSLTYIQDRLKEGTLTCTQRVGEFLQAIESHNPRLNAFISVFEDALKRAKDLDNRISQGQMGKLAGLVVGIKDVLAYQEHPLNAASKILGSFTAPYHATVVERLLREDAVLIGRQNCDEFGMGSSTENSAFGPSRNPIDTEKTPGGSSGGSAAAVAAGLCDVALGSDTGGSVRQPAAFCGVYGLKPTYGRISRHGLVAYASSFDTVGVISRNVEDMARVLSVIAGADEFDSTVSRQPVPDYAKSLAQESNHRVAVLRNVLNATELQDEVRDALHEAIRHLRSLGHTVDEVDFPLLDFILPAYYILATAEASSNLSRYDGVRYGHRSKQSANLSNMYQRTRSEGFGKEVKRRILLGTFVLSAEYQDAYHTQAQRVRRLIRNATTKLLTTYDILLMPTTPSTAFTLGSKSDPLSMYLSDIFSVQANVAGVPAISFPYGKDRNGLPIGLQALARDFEEGKLMGLARILSVDR